MAAKRGHKDKVRNFILVPFMIKRNDCSCGYTFSLMTLIDVDVLDHDDHPHMEFLQQKPNYCPACGVRMRGPRLDTHKA